MAKLVERFQALMWRWNYAGYIMQKQRVPYNVAMRQAYEAQEVYDWRTWHPRTLADYRASLWLE